MLKKICIGQIMIIILVASCGVPVFIYIADITTSTVSNTSITFLHNINNNIDEFIGYTLYYKFYDQADNGAQCRDDKAHIQDESITILGTSRLIARNYKSVVAGDNINNITTINIRTSKNNSYTFLLSIANYLDTTSPEPSQLTLTNNATNTSTAISLYRNAPNSESNSNYKPLRFLQGRNLEFDENDADIQGIITNIQETITNQRLYIAFYAIGYGLTTSFQQIYGKAVFLGYISLFGHPLNQSC